MKAENTVFFLRKKEEVMRSLKIFFVFVIAVGLAVFMGGGSVVMASHSTHFVSDKGPLLPQNETGCYVCHAPGNLQCGPDAPLFADDPDPQPLSTTAVCNTCHSEGGAFDGVAMAKANWYGGVYEEDGLTLKSRKDKWCAGCHDQDPPETVIQIDDFEGYQCDADCDPDPDNPPVLELQANWARAKDARLPLLEPSGGPDGSKCMNVRVKWTRTKYDYGVAKRTFASPIDLTGMDFVNFYVKVDSGGSRINRIKVRLVKSPGGELCGANFYATTTLVPGVWKLVSLPRSSFNDTTWGLVSEIQFVLFESNSGLEYEESAYFDDIYFSKVLPLPGGGGPNVVGDNQTYGYYVTGHKFRDCTWCHDSTKQHIDGESLPILEYIKNTPNPTNFRFYDDPTKGLTLPYNGYDDYVAGPEGSFALCYWCHDEAKILDQSGTFGSDADTNFKNQYHGEMCDSTRNLHYTHIVNFHESPWAPSCVHCHDPHGKRNPAMTRIEMADSIYFDVNGCEIEQGADTDGDGIDDWHDPDINRGLALQDALNDDHGDGLNCSEVCHMSIWSRPPNDPPCNPEDNPYTEPGGCIWGYYTRDYKFIPHGVGPCEDCHEGHAFESHNMHTEANAKGPTSMDCSGCHGVEGAYSLDNLECEACHGIGCAPPPQGWIGGIDTIVASGACDNCHGAGDTFDGVTVAKDNWDTGVYEEDGTLKSGNEQWCATCHNDVPSIIEGVYAPKVAGDNSTYGYYASGHGKNVIPLRGTLGWPTERIECLDCHDASITHIDGESRTYAFDDSINPSPSPDYYSEFSLPPVPPEEQLSGVAYASGYRLRYVDGKVPLMIPADMSTTFGWNTLLMRDNSYRLCFSCHSVAKIFDDILDPGFSTNFMARAPDPPRSYSYWWEVNDDVNQHVMHMMTLNMEGWDSDWDPDTVGLGPFEGDSQRACSTCHNVHGPTGDQGSTNEAMIRDGSLANRTGFGFRYLKNAGYPMVTSTGVTQSISVGAVFENSDSICYDYCHLSPAPPSTTYDASGDGPGTYLEYYRPWDDTHSGLWYCEDFCHDVVH